MINYSETAQAARKKTLELIWKAGTSHIGSCLSAIDIMTVLFEKADTQKDEVILSAGWKAAAWYYFLHKKGIITENELNSFCQKITCTQCKGDKKLQEFCGLCNRTGKIQSRFIGLTEPVDNRWGLRFAGGSMGLSFPASVGFALSKKLKGEEGKVYCLMSDGECQIGTFYESILIAKQHNLSNLEVWIDNNSLQAMGKTKDILNIEPLKERLKVFGWHVHEIDGHKFEEIEEALNCEDEKPTMIVANTIKGKGVSFTENNNLYHYKQLSSDEYERAMSDLNK